MALLPLAFAAFAAGGRPTLERVAAGLGGAGIAALAVHLAFAVATGGAPSIAGEALRFTLRNDVSFTALAVMAFLMSLGWWAETRRPPAAAATAAAATLLLGGMSRGAWVVGLAGIVAFWWLSRRRTWWALAVPAALALAGVAAVLAASSLVIGRGRPLVERQELVLPPVSETVVDIRRDVAVTGGPVEITYAARAPIGSPPTLVVEARDGAGRTTVLAQQLPNPIAPALPQRFVQFLPAGTVSLDLWVWHPGGAGEVVTCSARELPCALAGWLRVLDLRIRQTAVALAHPSRDGTTEYRLAEWAAVRAAWADASWLRLLIGQGLGATVGFSNSSWDESGNRVQAPTASYLHNFYVFLGFKLGLAGVAALAGLAMIVAWTWRTAARGRPGGFPMLAAAAACWCAYLLWSVASPEILDFHAAPLWGAIAAASVSDAARALATRDDSDSRSQSSSTSSA